MKTTHPHSGLLPLPDQEGIHRTKLLYQEKFGRTLTDEEAAEILGKVMRYLFLVSLLTDEIAPTSAWPIA